jgi:hypothetical protein
VLSSQVLQQPDRIVSELLPLPVKGSVLRTSRVKNVAQNLSDSLAKSVHITYYQEGVTGRSRDMGWGVGGGLRILNEVFGSEKI